MSNFNSYLLPQGIPFLGDYLNLPKADLFLEMEQFSNSFIKLHNCKHDPFHQWSRCWEYPFTYSHILWHMNSKLNERLNNKVEFSMLDPDSPFFLITSATDTLTATFIAVITINF